MKPGTSIILGVIMFLQYYIWGSWYVTMGTFMIKFLGSTGIQIGAAYSALAIATMISPFFTGMITDRYFAAQKVRNSGGEIEWVLRLKKNNAL